MGSCRPHPSSPVEGLELTEGRFTKSKSNLLLSLLWLRGWLLKDLKDLLIDNLLLGLGRVGGDIESWGGGELGDAILGDG